MSYDNFKTKHKSLSINHNIFILILYIILEFKYNFKKNGMRKFYKIFSAEAKNRLFKKVNKVIIKLFNKDHSKKAKEIAPIQSALLLVWLLSCLFVCRVPLECQRAHLEANVSNQIHSRTQLCGSAASLIPSPYQRRRQKLVVSLCWPWTASQNLPSKFAMMITLGLPLITQVQFNHKMVPQLGSLSFIWGYLQKPLMQAHIPTAYSINSAESQKLSLTRQCVHVAFVFGLISNPKKVFYMLSFCLLAIIAMSPIEIQLQIILTQCETTICVPSEEKSKKKMMAIRRLQSLSHTVLPMNLGQLNFFAPQIYGFMVTRRVSAMVFCPTVIPVLSLVDLTSPPAPPSTPGTH
ncbi:hypothetical protein VP01_1255g1 [Puccinia sorghi]|uniref:Uncharacterized protein n=1 Tax=Puccinia sorghi TaxID=27349 RepID=A0A0L6VPB6_9BASI|nr:hypothetical protein VP01_1255g1 [Puccinia sorghi]